MNSSDVISQVLFTSEQPKKNKMAFVGILSQIKLLFGPLSYSACVVYLSNIPQVSMGYLSNRPQVSVVYFINHAGCW